VPRDRSRHERRSGDNDHAFSGLASYYAERQRLASDRAYNAAALTAAHRTLPFGTRLQVSDPKSGRSVIVTINDRGPFVRGRVLDLSPAAARALGMIGRGVMPIKASVQEGRMAHSRPSYPLPPFLASQALGFVVLAPIVLAPNHSCAKNGYFSSRATISTCAA
jgi:rare lipoprotein A (peptidoglycan hydrolase)